MSYSSYTEYIVFNNVAVITAVFALNSLASKFNVWPLLYLLQHRIVQIAEFIFVLFCLRNIYSVTYDIVDPYLEYLQLVGRSYITAGSVTEALFQIVLFPFKSVKKPASIHKTSTMISEADRILQTLCNGSQNYNNIPVLEDKPTLALAPLDLLPVAPITPEDAACFALDTAYSKQPTLASADIPTLVYTPCYQPPPQPPIKHPRRLWYVGPTPSVIEDFRIEQMLELNENWSKFDRKRCEWYDGPLKAALLKYIFTPLSESIDIYNEMLGPMYDVTNCPPRAIAQSLFNPEVKDCAPLNLKEIRDFLCLGDSVDKKQMKYVYTRIKDLARSQKMHGHRYFAESGMPTDDQIIMHCLRLYLQAKEPHIIPPLVPADLDIFKFLLIYVYITPELAKWEVF